MDLQSLPSSQFMPHGMCFLWDSQLLWLHVMADAMLALSYSSIPIALAYFSIKGSKAPLFADRGRTLPFKILLAMLVIMFVGCGLTHAMGIWSIWFPDYYVSGILKFVAGGISIVTAALLWPMVRKVVTLPNLYSLQEANLALKLEIEQRQAVEQELRILTEELTKSNRQLTKANQYMTGRELKMIELKGQVNELSRALKQPLPYEMEHA